jgi:pimeloyl-ACP methyl ester carboxylesterase
VRLLDRLSAFRADVVAELADSGHAAVYLRQLLRGDRVPSAASAIPDADAAVGPAQGTATSAPGQPPVLLIHGFLANRGSLHLLERRLHDRGYVVFSYRLGLASFGDIRRTAAVIAAKVESLAAQTGVARVDVVGHSMGGLVGLYYVKRLGGERRVRRLILLGTPAAGTWSALLGLVAAPLGRAGLQLLPRSAFLRDLHDGPLPVDVDVVSIAGERDAFAPVGSTLLAGVRQIQLPIGHSGLLVDPGVADIVDRVLHEPSRARQSPAAP